MSVSPLPISLCMIVKNEARLISQCLERARGVVSQIVVVDTGSTDDTVQLAEEAGAEVYHHPWEGHFSVARNQSLRYATQPWVLILDGDELLAPDAADALRALNLEAEGPEAYEFTVVNFTTDRADEREASLQRQVRLFRRSPEHGYAGLIHNQLIHLSEGRPLRHWPAEVRVLHYGYTPSVWASQNKDARLSMLEEAAKAEPDHLFHFYNLGNHLKILKRYPEALEAFLKALPLQGEHEAEWLPIAYCSAAFCAQSAGLPEQALALAERALQDDPNLIDAHVRAAEAELRLKRLPQVIDRLTRALLNPHRHAIKLASLHFYAPYRLGRALWLSKRPLEALPLFLSLIPRTTDVTVFTHAVLCAWNTGEPALAHHLLTLGRELAPDDPDWGPIGKLLSQGQPPTPSQGLSPALSALPLCVRLSPSQEQGHDLWEQVHGCTQREALARFCAHWSPELAEQACEGSLPLGCLPRLTLIQEGQALPSGLVWLIELDESSARLSLRVDGELAWGSPASIPVAMGAEDEERAWGPVALYTIFNASRFALYT